MNYDDKEVLLRLMIEHNCLVKDNYICKNSDHFHSWLVLFAKSDHVVIPSSQTISGEAELLTF